MRKRERERKRNEQENRREQEKQLKEGSKKVQCWKGGRESRRHKGRFRVCEERE